jgi:hypothetical protein
MVSSGRLGPARWANDLTQLLDLAKAENRYPVDVEQLILEISRTRWPDDPVLGVEIRPLTGFEGALVPLRDEPRGWLVICNASANEGRRRFTVAHEVGHYLMHRHLLPAEGIYCKVGDLSHRDIRVIEREADTFAASLLMPFHDLRLQLDPRAKPTLEDLGALAGRYGVSLTALVLRWLAYTERRAVVVVSTDGYILWSWSSAAAHRTGCFFRTSGPPQPIHEATGAARPDLANECRAGMTHPPGVWFDEAVEEFTVHARRHEQVISILQMGDAKPRWFPGEEPEPDVVDRFEASKRLR